MQDEIFGPILPIIDVNTLDEVISFIKKREKPLSLYMFSPSSKKIDQVVHQTSSGSIVVNDLIMHMSCEFFRIIFNQFILNMSMNTNFNLVEI